MNHSCRLLAFAALLTPVLECQSAPVSPNVLFIAIDDLNDWIGPLRGHPQVKTPNMDRLAKRGVVFTNAHCAAPLCNPSRASIFSGRHPFETGVLANDESSIRKDHPDLVLIPQHFSQNGYRTFGSGNYICYAGGNEELYDSQADPHEWANLAAKPEHAATVAAMRDLVPKVSPPAAKPSKKRKKP